MSTRFVSWTGLLTTAVLVAPSPVAGRSSERHPVTQVRFEPGFWGLVFLRATVNSAGPYQFLLDTGGVGTHVDRELTRTMGLKQKRGVASVSGDAALEVGVVPSATVEVSGDRFEGRILATPLARLEPVFGRRLEGILGGDWLQRRVVEIDFDEGMIRMHDPDAFRGEGRGSALPMSIVGGIPFVDLEVSLPNGRSVKGSFLVDTGGGLMAIHVHRRIAERDGLLAGLRQLAETGVGIGGETSRVVARGSWLAIGSHRLLRPFVAVTDDTAGLDANPSSVGLVGMEVLRRFNLVFDYSKRRIHLEPNGAFAEPFIYDASGLRLRAEPPSFSPPLVSSVREASPAQEAGMAPGDLLLALDGRDISGASLQQVRESLHQPGRTHRLTLSRKGETIRTVLRTRELLP